MSRGLLDLRMHDRSRHFGGLPQGSPAGEPEWERLRDAVPRLAGATLTGFVSDAVTEAWLQFEWRGQRFAINNQHGEWWFFVDDPDCPDELLVRVLDHFAAALSPSAALARARGELAPGRFRVLVYEADSRVESRDFSSLDEAARYADDVASEAEHGPALALVFDHDFCVVRRGRHY